jgi:hypothetical protein
MASDHGIGSRLTNLNANQVAELGGVTRQIAMGAIGAIATNK